MSPAKFFLPYAGRQKYVLFLKQKMRPRKDGFDSMKLWSN